MPLWKFPTSGSSDFLDGILYWRGLSGKKDQPAALVYGGEASYLREGVVVMSWKTWG